MSSPFRTGTLATLLLVIALPPAFSQSATAQDLADEIAVTQLGPDPAQPSEPLSGESAGPVPVSVLDILTKLALLVLAVYGVAWGVNIARRNGFRLGSLTPASQNTRLRECECLRLGATGTLYLVEVDRRSVLVAGSPAGDLSLVLDLSAANRQPEPARETREQAPDDTPVPFDSDLQADLDWAERRDALIRALAQQG